MRITNTGTVGIGTNNPGAKLHVISTDTTNGQLRVGYDPSNYLKITASSLGSVDFDATGTGAGFTFSDNINLQSNLLQNAKLGTDLNTNTYWLSNASGLRGTDGGPLYIKGNYLDTASIAQSIVFQTLQPSLDTMTTRMTINAGDGTVDIDIANANLDIGANKLKTTNLLIKQESSTNLAVRNVADNAYLDLHANAFAANNFYGKTGADTTIRHEENSATRAINLQAGTGADWVTVASLKGSKLEIAAGKLTGNLDAYTQLIQNIGSLDTDFTTGGGLNLAGKLGIGTTNPVEKFEISGNAKLLQYGANASSTITQSSSNQLILEGSFWTGTAETKHSFKLQNVASTTQDQDADLKVFWDTTELFKLNKSGAITLSGTSKTINGQTIDSTSQFNNLNLSGTLNVGTAYPGGGVTITSTGDVKASGNIYLKGSVWRESLQELLVKNNTITLNSGGSAQDAYIKVDATSAEIKWDNLNAAWDLANNLTLRKIAAADATNTTRDSRTLTLQGAYWTGAASNNLTGGILLDVTDATGPKYGLSFQLAGAGQMFLDQQGYLGLGIAPATEKLQVNSGNILLSDTYDLRWGDSTTYIEATSSGTTDRISFVTNASEQVRIDADGEVGIGTINPLAKLHVKDAGTALVESTSTDPWLQLHRNVVGGQEKFKISVGAIRTDLTVGDAGTTTALSIKENGYLGAGTTNINAPLTIKTRTTNDAGGILFEDDTTSSQYAAITLAADNSLALFGYDGAWGERVRIKPGGNFGINTTNPTSRLQVHGDTLIVGTADAIQLRIKANTTQTSSLQEWQNSGGAILGKVAAGGTGYFNGLYLGTGGTPPTTWKQFATYSDPNLKVNNLYSGGAITFNNAADTQELVRITAATSASPPPAPLKNWS
jgi:hypothetical protein